MVLITGAGMIGRETARLLRARGACLTDAAWGHPPDMTRESGLAGG